MKKLICIFALLTLTSATASAAVSEARLRSVVMGSGREDVHAIIGDPAAVSGNGARETYELSADKTAVLQYDGDTLSRGFIIN